MAKLTTQDGETLQSTAEITAALAPLNISVAEWPTGEDAELKILLDKSSLSDDEKEQVLQHLERYFRQLEKDAGYQTRDLIVLHPELPNLDDLLAKFERCHTHADDEVRYIIDGEGVFGFVLPSGDQMRLEVRAGEYINVPAGAEHWFYLTDTKRIKAVRYFTSTDGWTPEYTGTEIRA